MKHTLCALSALSNFMAVYARSFIGYVLQYNSKGHWKVNIISIAAEGTKVAMSRSFLF